jgi:PilZ domain
MSSDQLESQRDYVRVGARIHSVKDISATYEGRTGNIANRPPDVSTRGMFVNTSHTFSEGAVLNLRFRLGISGADIQARGEVRYSLPGVGVGVEFVGLPARALRKIENELELWRLGARRHKRGESQPRLSRKRRASKKKPVARTG